MGNNQKNNNEYLKLIHDHAWNHFELNAKQRVDLFKYYIIFLSIFGTRFYHINEFRDVIEIKLLGLILPIMFAVITYIFHML